jgi:hypothetical protein
MLTSIGINGIETVGEEYLYHPNCLHQPVDSYWRGFDNYSSPAYVNDTLYSSYNLCPQNPAIIPLLNNALYTSTYTNVVEKTSLYVYCLFLAVNYLSPDPHPIYHGDIGRYVYPIGNPPVINKPNIIVYNSGGAAYYRYDKFAEWDSKLNFHRIIGESSNAGLPVKPNYIHLLNGYPLDDRTKLSRVEIVPAETKTINLEYYQQNTFEPVPGLRSIDVSYYQVDLIKDKPCVLPINDCVMGTLYCDDSDTINLISNFSKPNQYDGRYFFEANLPELFSGWDALYNTALNAPLLPPAVTFTPIETLYAYQVEIDRKLRTIGANNDCWNNRSIPTPDLNFDPTHPVFLVDNDRAYEWHIKPQSDGSFGDLVMNSPLLINIGKAVDAGKWSVNLDDPDLPRVDNLGWRTNRICEVLGIRVKPDGTIDEPLEKTDNRRQHAEREEQNDPQEYNPNCFGSKGMLVRYLPNKFKPKGKDVETIEGGFRKVKDIPQLLAELHEQANAAMGYQEGTAIEITVDDETYRYPNQLALLTEIFVTLKQSGVYSKGAFFSSVVAEQSIKEVIGGLGLRTVDKYLEFKIAGKTAKLYYKGISASQSIRRKLSAISTNIGTIIGNIT